MRACKNNKTVQKYHWRKLPQLRFLSRQKFCHVSCRDKSILVAKKKKKKKSLSRQKKKKKKKKKIVAIKKFFRDKSIVATNILLSRQKTCFVATKIILGASPTNNTKDPKSSRILYIKGACVGLGGGGESEVGVGGGNTNSLNSSPQCTYHSLYGYNNGTQTSASLRLPHFPSS